MRKRMHRPLVALAAFVAAWSFGWACGFLDYQTLAIKQPKPRNLSPVIEWSGGTTLHTVLFKIDGETIGRGKEAYQRVLKVIEELPDHSNFTVTSRVESVGEAIQSEIDNDIFPFQGHEAEQEQFSQLRLKKNLMVACCIHVREGLLTKVKRFLAKLKP